MYAGKPVETAPVDELFNQPRMPYTIGLLGSIPRLDAGRGQPLTPIEGSPPSLVALPPGCPFTPRCPARIAKCSEVEPDAGCADDDAPRGMPPRQRDPGRDAAPERGVPGRCRRTRPAGAATARAARGRARDQQHGQALPAHQGCGVPPHGRAPCTPSTASASTSARARHSLSSVSPGAARPRRSWRSSAWSRRRTARSRCWASRSPG